MVKGGERRVGRYLCIDCRPSDLLRLGISASVRYGPSHERNRFKRLVREAFRLSFSEFSSKLDLNVIPRQFAKKASRSDIQEDLIRLLSPSS